MPAKNAKYTYGNGSRKASTATARLYKGKGEITINDKPALEYLSGNKTLMAEVTDPLAMVQKQKEYDITILVKGGGIAGQVDAIKLAISRALVAEFPRIPPGAQESRPHEARPTRKGTQTLRSTQRSQTRTIQQALIVLNFKSPLHTGWIFVGRVKHNRL